MFENKDKIVIVMELGSRGDLYDYLSERQRISESEARHFFRQIVSAVQYCHRVSNTTPILSSSTLETGRVTGSTIKHVVREHFCQHVIANSLLHVFNEYIRDYVTMPIMWSINYVKTAGYFSSECEQCNLDVYQYNGSVRLVLK